MAFGNSSRAPSSSSTPGHPRHALVGEHERERLAAPAQLAHELVGLGARAGAQHAVLLAEAAAEVALHGAQDGRLVVDDEQGGAAGRGLGRGHAADHTGRPMDRRDNIARRRLARRRRCVQWLRADA